MRTVTEMPISTGYGAPLDPSAGSSFDSLFCVPVQKLVQDWRCRGRLHLDPPDLWPDLRINHEKGEQTIENQLAEERMVCGVELGSPGHKPRLQILILLRQMATAA